MYLECKGYDMKQKIALITMVCSMVYSTSAAADQSEIDVLKQQLLQMQSQMQVMQERLIELEQENAKHKNQFVSKQQVQETVEQVIKDSDTQQLSDVSVAFKPGLAVSSKDKAFSFGVDGAIQIDTSSINDDALDRSSGTTIRRARLGLKGTFFKEWHYRFQAGFGNGSETIVDAYGSYTGFDGFEIKAGQFKEPFSLEQIQSARNITFVERATLLALSPARSIGLQGKYHTGDYTLTAGVFGDNVNTQSTDDEAISFTGRATALPYQSENSLLHVGLSGSYRLPDRANDEVSFSAGIEETVQTVDAVDTGAITNVEGTVLFGAELAGYWGPFSLQGEYAHADVSRDNGFEDVSFDAAYIQGSWFLTGEHRSYSRKNAVFGGVSPKNPPGNGGIGAFEIGARYSTIDLTDGPITGGESDNISFSFSWYPNKYTRFLANYTIVDTDENAVVPNDDPQIFSTRFQVDF